MEEENPKNCRALSRRNPNMPSNTPLSYFISIAMPQTNMKIKMPKLLKKSMKRRNHKCNDSDDVDHCKNKKKWTQPRRLLPKKVGSIMQNVFGNKKSQEMCSSNCEKERVLHRQSVPESDAEVKEENGKKNLNVGDEPFPPGTPDSKMSELQLMKETSEVENEKGKQEKFDDEKSLQPSVMADKQSLKVSLSLSCFFNKKTKGNRTNSFRGSGNGVGLNRVIGRQESSSNFSRVPSRRQNGCRKITRAKSTRKKGTKQVEEESEQGGEELCKKRILMGGKCRPLSGTLQYDKNGILLPEIIPCEEF